MRRRHGVEHLVASLALLGAAGLSQSCLTATAIHVSIYSDVPCALNAPVDIVLGTSPDDLATQLAQSGTSSSKTGCTTPGTPGFVGDVVIVPNTSRDEPLAFAVATRTDGQPADRCGDPSLPLSDRNACIVSKRSLRFVPHETDDVRIDLRISCVGVVCPVTSTCVDGSCLSAACVASSCSDLELMAQTQIPPTLVPHPVTSAGSVSSPTGLAQQLHLIYAENDQRYWFFYIDSDSAQVKTRVSTDLANWSDGGTLSLGTGTSGTSAANFSVAYANKGGVDVIELVIDEPTASSGFTFHLRATLTGEPGAEKPSIAASTQLYASDIGSNNCNPDGPSTVVASDGRVYDATGWQFIPATETHCDMDVYESSAAEMGASTFNATFAQTGYFVTLAYTTAHQMVAFADTPNVFGAWLDNLDGDGKGFDAIAWTNSVVGYKGGNGGGFAGGQPIPGYLFDNKNKIEIATDDWSLCRLADTDLHAIAHTTDPSNAAPKVFENAVFDGKTWNPEASPPPLQSIINTGTVTLGDGNPAHGMVVFVIGSDGSTLNYSRFTPPANGVAGSWSSWSTFAGTAQRKWLAGTGCGSTRPALLWSEGADPGPYQIVGADVSSLFQ